MNAGERSKPEAMEFVVLYGRPAVGKLTVARELSALTGYAIFDNHLVVDVALALYDFGSKPFIALRDALWRAAFAEIAQQRALPGLIFTFNPEASVPQAFIDDLFAMFAAAGVPTRCFELKCPEEILEQRLVRPDRQQKRKLVDIGLYRKLRSAGTFDTPAMPPDRCIVDTGLRSPAESAEFIAEALRPR